MSDAPGYLTTLDYAARWGIEPMFSDFKSRGFGLEQSQLRTPDRLGRLLLVMGLALYFAVSTGIWDATVNPSVDEKKSPTSAQEPEPQQAVLVHQRAPIHRQVGPVLPAYARTLGNRMKLMGVQGGGYRRDHLRALAQRVEVANGEVRIMGSKSDLLRALAAASGVKSAAPGVRSSVPKWRPRRDSNPRPQDSSHFGFRRHCPKRGQRSWSGLSLHHRPAPDRDARPEVPPVQSLHRPGKPAGLGSGSA